MSVWRMTDMIEQPISLAIMQPYFLPYIGYFQLIAAADTFILYDNIKYTKKGWINRNRMLRNGSDVPFSLQLRKDSDYLHVCERQLAANFERQKLLNQFKGAYERAPFFSSTFALIEEIVRFEEGNLFRYLHNSIVKVCERLDIATDIVPSSKINIDHSLRGQDKVLAICNARGAHTYINAIGGVDLYSKEDFLAKGIELKFIETQPLEYEQFGGTFVPWLSIIDVMMFNPLDDIKSWVLTNYELT